MDHLGTILPTLLVVLAFSYKIVVDKRFTLPDFIERLIEMPVEIVFLAGGFLIAFVLQDAANHEFGLLCLFLGIFVTMFVFILSKRAQEEFLRDNTRRCASLAIFSFLPSLFTYVFSVNLLTP